MGAHGKTGCVRIGGRDRSSYDPQVLAKKIACIPRSPAPSFSFRVLDVVMMGRTAHMRCFGSHGAREAKIALRSIGTRTVCVGGDIA